MKTKLLFTLCIIICCAFKVKSQSGNNMVFNGTSNYIVVSDHNDLDVGPGENYTITCWIKTTQWKNMPVFRKRDPSGVGYEMTVGSGGAYAINMRSTTSVNVGSTVASYNMNLNQWYHLAMVVDVVDKSTKTYVNGVLQGTTTNANIGTLSFENAVDVTIGRSVDQNRYFIGQMDDIRVWNKAFTPTELLADMATTVVNNSTPDLLAAWDFENVTGSSVPDVSGRGHNGTINGPVVLPIELASFSAKAYGSNVHLEWTTASEKNNDFFEVQRSVDGKTFLPVVKVAGAINSNTPKNYKAIDENPIGGINYYRLKQTDLDGTSTYHKIISVEVLTGLNLKLYPNPAQEFIILNIPKPENLNVEIFDLNGKKYKVSSKTQGNQLIVNTSVLNKGVYILKTKNGDNDISTSKFLVK